MNRKSSGFIDTIVLVVIALIILGYFNIDIKNLLSGPVVRSNLEYFWTMTLEGAQHGWAYAQDFLAANWHKIIPN
ncbi:MAG: hypothetical protein V4519_02830 [Patescibacteria group bacterium]